MPEVVALAQVTDQDVRACGVAFIWKLFWHRLSYSCVVVLTATHSNPIQVLFDLGCGDGRVCIEGAKATGARAVGEIEIEVSVVCEFIHAHIHMSYMVILIHAVYIHQAWRLSRN